MNSIFDDISEHPAFSAVVIRMKIQHQMTHQLVLSNQAILIEHNKRFDKIDEKFAQVDKRLNNIERDISSLKSDVSNLNGKMDTVIDILQKLTKDK